jgi:hypothetical protein
MLELNYELLSVCADGRTQIPALRAGQKVTLTGRTSPLGIHVERID